MNGNSQLGEFNVEFTDEQKLVQQSVREFAQTEVKPHVMELDESQTFPHQLVKRMGELGFLGAIAPAELGGAGMTTIEFCIIMEELARVDPSLALFLAGHSGLCLQHVLMHASEEQKAKYVPDLASGKAIGSWCLTEPSSGSDSAGMMTTAVLKGDHYVLNGRKVFITNGGVADLYSVMAVTKPGKKIEGISAFVVEKGTPGLSIGKTEEKMGIRGSNTTEVILEDVKVPIPQRIGVEDGGWWLMMRTLNRSRPAIAAQAVGVAQGALDCAIRFIKEKNRAGQQNDAQGVRAKIADLAIEIEAARALAYKSAAMMDAKVKGIPVQMFSSMAKYYASDIAMKVTTEVVQMMQWNGLVRDFPAERMMRDAKVLQIYEGTNQIQRMVVSHTLLR